MLKISLSEVHIYEVKNIVLEKEFINGYHVYSFDADLEMDIPYAAGKFSELIPEDRYKNSKMEHYDSPLFNESNLTKRVIPVGKNGLYFLQLISGYWLDSMIVEPDDVVIDIYFSKDKKLIYSFYNPTNQKNINLKLRKALDKERIIDKIKAHPTDLYWRDYFVRQSLIKYESNPSAPHYPDVMTTDQAADYLNIAPKTLRNLTSQKKVPKTEVGRSVKYLKSDLKQYLRKKN